MIFFHLLQCFDGDMEVPLAQQPPHVRIVTSLSTSSALNRSNLLSALSEALAVQALFPSYRITQYKTDHVHYNGLADRWTILENPLRPL